MIVDTQKIAVLVSGGGTNLQAIINAIKSGELQEAAISIVISDKKNAYALKRAEAEGIKTLCLNPKDYSTNIDYDKKLVELISSYKVDLIVLAGYLRVLTGIFVNAFPNKIINIHPALLPDFGGKGMYGNKVHEEVLKSGVKESGCTVHFVTTKIDSGPIIGQKKVPVLEGDTVETLSKRVLEEEHKLLVEAIKIVLFGATV